MQCVSMQEASTALGFDEDLGYVGAVLNLAVRPSTRHKHDWYPEEVHCTVVATLLFIKQSWHVLVPGRGTSPVSACCTVTWTMRTEESYEIMALCNSSECG